MHGLHVDYEPMVWMIWNKYVPRVMGSGTALRCGDIPTARVDSKLKQDQKRGETPQRRWRLSTKRSRQAKYAADPPTDVGLPLWEVVRLPLTVLLTACRQQQNAAEREGTPPNLRRTDEYAEDQNRYEIDHAVEADLTEVLVSAGDCHCGR